MLLAVEQCERGGGGRRADEGWRLLEEEWRQVRRSRRVSQHLRQQLEAWGAADPDSVAEATLAAVEDELLPILRIKWFLLRGQDASSAQRHLAAISNWHFSSASQPAIAYWYGVFLLKLSTIKPCPDLVVEDNVLRLLQGLEAPSAEAQQLVDGYAAYLEQAMGKQFKESRVSVPWLQAKVEAAEKIEAAAPPSLALLESLAVLYLLLAVQHSQQPLGLPESARCLAVARSYDPFSRATWENIDTVLQLAERLREELAPLAAAQQLNFEGLQLWRNLSRIAEVLNEFPTSSRGLQIEGRRARAIGRELPRRLGLDPDSEADRSLAEGLASLVGSHCEEEDLPDRVRELAQEQLSGAERLPWDRVIEALGKTTVRNGEFLTLLLPAPQPAPDNLIAPLTAAEAAGETPQQSAVSLGRGTFFSLWLFSSRDLLWKAAALLGVVVAAYAIAAGVSAHRHASHQQRLYAAVLTAVRDGHDAVAIEDAQQFLSRATAEPDDPRIPQVRGLLEEALLRETLRLGAEGRMDEAATLLR